MFRLRHQESRRHFAQHETEIVSGVRQLAESLAIEVTETVADVIPGSFADGIAKRRVRAEITPRIEDAIAGLRSIDNGPSTTKPMLAEAASIDPKQLAQWGVLVLPAILLLRLVWPKLSESLAKRVIKQPEPAQELGGAESHQQQLIADDAAFTRLQAKAERQNNQPMRDALQLIASQWRIEGPEVADEDD